MRELIDIGGLMAAQKVFENYVRGTDGSLADYNTPEKILTRGVIGEAEEALEALRAGEHRELLIECVDILIFLSSMFVHLDVSPDEVNSIATKKMMHNFLKYNHENFEGRTIEEGIAISRELWNQR